MLLSSTVVFAQDFKEDIVLTEISEEEYLNRPTENVGVSEAEDGITPFGLAIPSETKNKKGRGSGLKYLLISILREKDLGSVKMPYRKDCGNDGQTSSQGCFFRGRKGLWIFEFILFAIKNIRLGIGSRKS